VHDRVRYYQVSPEKWKELQHYGKPNPIWIKLYLKLHKDDGFFALDETGRLQVVTAWLLAGHFNNRIPDRGRAVEQFNLSESPMDFPRLVNTGFLVVVEEKAEVSRDFTPSREPLEDAYSDSSAEQSRDRVDKSRAEEHSGDALETLIKEIQSPEPQSTSDALRFFAGKHPLPEAAYRTACEDLVERRAKQPPLLHEGKYVFAILQRYVTEGQYERSAA
jgi:hypothetical protein